MILERFIYGVGKQGVYTIPHDTNLNQPPMPVVARQALLRGNLSQQGVVAFKETFDDLRVPVVWKLSIGLKSQILAWKCSSLNF